MAFQFDVESIRKQFPACAQKVNGFPVAHLDSPAGTQVPQRVTDSIVDYLVHHNANEGGFFPGAVYADDLEERYSNVIADFLGCDADEVGFGCSTTQNNFRIAYSILKNLKPGDEIVFSHMEHRANSAPWFELEKHYGIVVKRVRVDPITMQVDMNDLESKLSPKTKVAAFNWASNVTGTVSDVKTMCAMAHKYGAITIVDAVHYAGHLPMDVKEIDTDILFCSAYKWFGPHIGVIYMKKALLGSMDISGVKTDDLLSGRRKFHFGTPQYELLGGVIEAVEFIATIGEQYAEHFADQLRGLAGRRKHIVAGMLAIEAYELPLSKRLRDGLSALPGVTLYGPEEGQPRTPTVSFTAEGVDIVHIAKELAKNGVNVWHGDFYAVELVHVALQLGKTGGVVRLGIAPYNTEGDIDRAISVIAEIIKK